MTNNKKRRSCDFCRLSTFFAQQMQSLIRTYFARVSSFSRPEPPSFIQFDSSFEAFGRVLLPFLMRPNIRTKRRQVIFSLVLCKDERKRGFAILAVCVCVRYAAGRPLVFARSRLCHRLILHASTQDARLFARESCYTMLLVRRVSFERYTWPFPHLYAIRIYIQRRPKNICKNFLAQNAQRKSRAKNKEKNDVSRGGFAAAQNPLISLFIFILTARNPHFSLSIRFSRSKTNFPISFDV